ncbi:MAG: hypothetical protein KGO50_16920 [Myxococcales bacterium]|nr:hypothetical protein [Myxococcales bacterium]
MELGPPVLFPQAIDHDLDSMVYRMLQRLDPVCMRIGIKETRSLLFGPDKPVLIVICTDAYGFWMGAQLQALLQQATMTGVPVVHALTRRELGRACRAKHCVTALAVQAIPDKETCYLAVAAMKRGVTAYGKFVDLFVPHSAAGPVDLAADVATYLTTQSLASLVF